jgi:hypothetical protein
MFIPHLSTIHIGTHHMSRPSLGLDDDLYNWPCDTVRQAPESQPQTRAHTDFDGADKVQKHYIRKEMSKCQHCHTHDNSAPCRGERTCYPCNCPQILHDQHMPKHSSHDGELSHTTECRDGERSTDAKLQQLRDYRVECHEGEAKANV